MADDLDGDDKQPLQEMSKQADSAMALQVRELTRYQRPGREKSALINKVRNAAEDMILVILRSCPPCADRNAAVRKIREGMLTGIESITTKPVRF